MGLINERLLHELTRVAAGKVAVVAPVAAVPIKTVRDLQPRLTAERKFKLNVFASLTAVARVSRVIEGTAQEVASQLAITIESAKKDTVPLFNVGVLRSDIPTGDSLCTLAALGAMQCVVLDFDHVTTDQVEAAKAALLASGFVHLMYPTHSWALDTPRFRIVVFLSRDMPVDQYPSLWAGLGALVGTCGDEAAKKPAQRYFLPSCPPGELHKRPAAIVSGNVLADPDALLALVATATKAWEQAGRTFDNLSVNDDIADQPSTPDKRDRDAGLIVKNCPMVKSFADGTPVDEPEWRAVIGVLKFCRDGEKLFHQWSALDVGRYQRATAQSKWDKYEAGPTRCGASPHCNGCQQRAKVTSPVQLGDPETAKTNPNDPAPLRQAIDDAKLKFVMDDDGRQNLIVPSIRATGQRIRSVYYADSEPAADAVLYAASKMNKPVSDRALETIKALKRCEARDSGETIRVHLRVASSDGDTYLDLGPGNIAKISASGVEFVDDAAEGVPLFRRGMGSGCLPIPVLFDCQRTAFKFAANVLVEHFGLTTAKALLVIVTLLDYLREDTPHVVLEFVGGAGSGKSTIGDFTLSLIDPAGDGGRVTMGTDSKDIGAVAQQRYVLMMDNASKLDKATSDMLCVISTGGSLLVRLLYSNSDVANLKLHRAVVITAVSPVAVAPDLQTRVVRIELPTRQGGHVSETELKTRLDALRPQMLGALLTLLSGAMRELPAVRANGTWGHRLVDFDQMGEAVVKTAGLKQGTFLEVVGQMRERMARRSASGDVFLLDLMVLLRRLSASPTHSEQPPLNAVAKRDPAIAVLAYGDNRIEITGRPAALHHLLMPVNWEHSRPTALPTTARGFADALRRVQPMLHGLGVRVQEIPFGTRTMIRFDFDLGAIHED